MMTLEEIKQTDWYKERPEIIQKAIDQRPPGLYRMKDGHQCIIYSYAEPDDDSEVTLSAIAFVLAILGFGTVASVYGTVWCAVVSIAVYVVFVVLALRMFIKR